MAIDGHYWHRPEEVFHAFCFRSNVPIKVKGSSLHIKEGHFEGQGFKIDVHAMANFYGPCMDFTLVDKTPVGVLNKV